MKWSRRFRARLKAALRAGLGAWRSGETALVVRIAMPEIGVAPTTIPERKALIDYAATQASRATAVAILQKFPLRIPKGREARLRAGLYAR